jgi:L-alanine-DL-glutamate epimerase-like enolase superfamily enzyme
MDEGRQPRAGAREPVENARALTLRRVDAIPVALPLAKPMKMAGITIAETRNLLVRVEAADGTVGWGKAPEAPTMTGDTLKGLVAAVEERLAAAISDLAAHADAGAAAGASLKFIKLGGVAEMLEGARYCARRGLAVNIAGKTADSGIGSAAIVHAACAVPRRRGASA